MTAGIHSPSTKNLLIGKGVCLLKPEGASSFYPVGNVPTLDLTPTVERLEHFSSMEGTKTKDEVIVLSKSGTIKMVMEEITANNIALLMLGDVASTGYGATITLFSRASITSAFEFYGTNDKGPRWHVSIPKVIWNPSGAFSPISDAYAKLEATGEWSALEGAFGTMTLLPEAGTVAPTNVLAPYIGGKLTNGSTAEVFVGAWIGATGYTYQWKLSATNKGTDKTQTFDSAGSWTCIVTATNAIGSTSVTTAAVTVV